MAVKETIEVVEESLDPVLEVGAVVARWTGRDYVKVGIIAAVSFAGGAAASYFITKKRLTKENDTILAEQLSAAREYYSKLNKADKWATPSGAAEALNVKAAVPTHQEIVEMYQPDTTEVKPTEDEVKDVNVFEKAAFEGWDYEQELSKRKAHPGEPYVISEDEYLGNEFDYEQTTLTYYAGDGVLTDEKDSPIDMIDMVVGESNLERFGHGNHSNGNIVFIRNDDTKMEFEVALHEGKFAHEVLGFIEHSDYRPRVRKFRGDDE